MPKPTKTSVECDDTDFVQKFVNFTREARKTIGKKTGVG
jgi:hypothetical protein